MIALRSASEYRDQPPISPRVLKHPRQSPVRPSTVQTWTQGVGIDRGGPGGRPLEFGLLASDIGSDATRPRG